MDKYRHKETRVRIVVADDTNEKLVTLTQSSKWDKKNLVGYLVDLCTKYRFDKPGWESRLNQALDQVEHNKFAFLDSMECPALQFDEKNYLCIWYKKMKPPTVLILGATESKARAHCAGCTKTQKVVEDADKFKELVTNGFVMDIPSCIYGGRISGEGKKIKLYCQNPKMTAQSRSVHNHCKILKAGAHCPGLRWSRMSGKLPDMKK